MDYIGRYTGEEIDERLTLAGTAYQKPSGGIPMTDLNSALQDVINGKMDKAVGFTVQPDEYLTFPASQMSLAVIIKHEDNVLPPIFVTGDNYARFFVSATEGWDIPVSFVSGTIEDGNPVIAIHNGIDSEGSIPVVVKVVSLTGDELPEISISEEGGFDEEPTPFPVRYLYAKPAEGIPASDMESGVQTSLDKADTALQPVSGATNGNLAGLNSQGKVVDSGKKIVTSWDNPPLDTNIPNEKLVYDSLYKRGVLSQTQTWTQAADGGYDYVMSDLVYGDIPKYFIDLWKSRGGDTATFNENTGYFMYLDLDDISYEEAKAIYANACQYQNGSAFSGAKARTALPCIYTSNPISYNILSGFAAGSDIEFVSMYTLSGEIGRVSNLSSAFSQCKYLRKVEGVIDVTPMSNQSSINGVFNQTPSIEEFSLRKLKWNLSVSSCPRLSNASILYMINNEAATSAITITLHATAYARATADADITAALANHPNVSLASA